MQVKINGEQTEVPDSIQYVSDLTKHLGIDQKTIVVEKNAEILERENHGESVVSAGDSYEIVTFVGGG
ncbi:sulfur carrier protein ThiS [Bacillus mangrovi]|uniref:Sulfur carrier protein ThiS n=1 Tax=Metabacillus mangrovi TaxID=1491830 RepID=A0A7X2S6X1_9BACI|nr:sulfur carrier protein ThiS [Metabacillus mangrovi]MTH54752.1 sulfur carrier protein ThiS [Metabacillus mangrovi]